MEYHWLTWGNGANAIGRYFPHDKETCTNCGKAIGKTDTPSYFELDRILCGKCQVGRPDISDISNSAQTDTGIPNVVVQAGNE